MDTVLEPEIVVEQLEYECATCHRMRDAKEFLDAPDGPLFDSCRGCRKSDLVEQNVRGKQVKDLAKQLVAEARGEHINSPHITEINAGMFKRAGGVDKFCEMWWDHIKLAMVDRPGSKNVLDQFVNIARLAKAATEHRDSAPDVASLTDEELGREMLKLAQQVLPGALKNGR